MKKILFPVDKSENAERAFEHAAELAKKFQATVVVVHVYHFLSGYNILENFDELSIQLKKELMDDCNALLAKNCKKLEAQGIETKAILKDGYPPIMVEEILKQEQCDVVVMGSRGLGKISGYLLGSVSNHMLSHAGCPVLIVH